MTIPAYLKLATKQKEKVTENKNRYTRIFHKLKILEQKVRFFAQIINLSM